MNHDHTETKRRGHGLMMALMCVPMLLIVGVLIATGVVGVGAAVTALGCVAAMGAMMFAMERMQRH